ncbi:MAG: polysaccharide deacetylase family protein [Bacteroidota bacterium]
MLIHKTNFLMRAIYPNFLWRIPTQEKEIYLTFDDGPIPEITEFVSEELNKYQAKATFFCIGDNIQKYPNVFQKLVNEQHTIGNHTFNHLKGWDTENTAYLENFKKCRVEIEKNNTTKFTTLFRPPYGRIKKSQAKEILKTHQIVMWDVLSGDYDQNFAKDKVLSKTIKYTEQGSIVLFHDSLKASKNMMYALPRVLEHFSERGFTFKSL